MTPLQTHLPLFLTLRKKNLSSEIIKLNFLKAIKNTDIPVKIVKENVGDFFSDYICMLFNKAIGLSKFSIFLKFANITHFKNGCRTLKENYRNASILPVIFRIFEKLMNKQSGPEKFEIPCRASRRYYLVMFWKIALLQNSCLDGVRP